MREIKDDVLDDDYTGDEEEEVTLQTHLKMNLNLSGEITLIERGYVELRLTTSADMVADDMGLVHGGFIFSAADFAAMAAVNERNVVLVGSDCQFLSPVRLHDEVEFVARVRHQDGKKRDVHVTGHVLDIKVFEGEFKTVITDRHVLRLKLLDEKDNIK